MSLHTQLSSLFYRVEKLEFLDLCDAFIEDVINL
jgi:hypothetical protein